MGCGRYEGGMSMKTINERFMYYAGILAAAGANVDDLKHISDLLDIEEQGRLIVLPCKMGDTVYIIGSKYRRGYFEDYINTGRFDITDLPKLGNSVFLTKEEAEKALEEMEK